MSFKVGDIVRRIKGCYNNMEIGDIDEIVGFQGGSLLLKSYTGGHLPDSLELHQPSLKNHVHNTFTITRVPNYVNINTSKKPGIAGNNEFKQLKGEYNMNKAIIQPPKATSKIIFLYDNGKKHHATKIKKFNALTKDIDGTECIEYSNHTGAHRVYRNDLAAITFICEDGYTTTQKLMDKVVVEADNARMYKKTLGV